MLSRRDKLLTQPWQERRYRDHRCKVKSALPVIDDRAPPPRPHVTLKLKKSRSEADRQQRIAADNFGLLQRLSALMSVNRLDNRWGTPKITYERKVGQFYTSEEVARRVRARRSRVQPPPALADSVRCYACRTKRLNFDTCVK